MAVEVFLQFLATKDVPIFLCPVFQPLAALISAETGRFHRNFMIWIDN
jgi:hypothetical protein